MLLYSLMQHPDFQRPDLSIRPQHLPARDKSLLMQLMRHIFGTKVKLADYRIIRYQADYIIIAARLEHPSISVTVKLAGPQAPLPCPFDRTAALLRLVRAKTAVPVPEVLAVDMSYKQWPWRYIIKTYVPGKEWAVVRPRMDKQELTNAYRGRH